MTATLLEPPTEPMERSVPCTSCLVLQRLERELGALRREVSELRCEVGYWKSRHADAAQRIQRLNEELEQSRGQVRVLQDKLFGRKSENSAKGNYGLSIWVLVLLDKYSSYRPTERLLGQLEQYDLDLPAGTINDGLQRIEPMLQPIYAAFCERNRQGDFHQADETRWLVFAVLDGKKGSGWWWWVVLGSDTVVYLLDPRRGHEVPQSHLGVEASGVLEVDRYSGYKAMTPVKRGLLLLAFCWAHVRRDFVDVGQSWTALTPWALQWLRCLRQVYHLNRERLQHPNGSPKFQEQDALLREAMEAMRAEAVEELSHPKLRQPCRKVLESLQEHWTGLVRFVDDPRIPLDNNASERAGRGPAVARKNFDGSGSLWSGRLAATMFSLLATLACWKINPRLWLTWYLENCAAAGGKVPDDIQPFLPWNLASERRAILTMPATIPTAPDSS
jgi:transposase